MENFGSSDSSQPCVCIGSKLRLLSQLKVRYEGTLYSVDTNQSTISLKSVKTYGTEGRSVDGNEVPASEEVFDLIVFRASDISEIFMIEGPSVMVDPAIVDYQTSREKQNAAKGLPGQRDFQPNVTSVSDSRVSTPGPESVQSGGEHAVPRHDLGHIGAKAVSKGWGPENHRANDRDHQWGQPHRSGNFDRRPPGDGRRDRDGYNQGENNGPYSSVGRKVSANNGNNSRTFQNQQHGGRNAGYGYGNDSRQVRQLGGFYGGQGGQHYGHDQDHRPGFRPVDQSGRSGWRDRQDYQRGGRPMAQGGFYNQRDGVDQDRHQRRPQYGNTRDLQASQRGRMQRKDGQGPRSQNRENQQRDSQPAATGKNVPEFDFEKANEEFRVLSLNQTSSNGQVETASGNGAEVGESKDVDVEDSKSTEPSYQKDSFFDEISRDSRQAQRPKTSERSLNMQTFGAAATRRRPATGRYYNRRPGNWTGSAGGGHAAGAEAATNGTTQVSA